MDKNRTPAYNADLSYTIYQICCYSMAIVSLFIVLIISMLVTRIGAMALRLTGMASETATFQSWSAFSGVGFTTNEAEDVLNHPVRRRIVILLMLLSNLGVGAVVATLMLSFNQTSSLESLIGFVAGLTLLWMFAKDPFVERHLNRLIAWGLLRFGNFRARDYVAILQLEDGYAVTELAVEKGDWLAERTLIDLKLPAEGVLVLGIRRAEGIFFGTPTADMTVHAGDTLTLYGPTNRIEEIDQRRRGSEGDAAHSEAIYEHEVGLTEQERLDARLEQDRD